MASLRKEFSNSFSYDLTGVFIGTQFTTNCRVSTLNQLVSGLEGDATESNSVGTRNWAAFNGFALPSSPAPFD